MIVILYILLCTGVQNLILLILLSKYICRHNMSLESDYACSFRDSNAEILALIKNGAFKQDPSTIKDILTDKFVKSKLSKVLHFYSKPSPQPNSKFDTLKWGGAQPLTNMIKTFITHLSQKLDLEEELTFRLVELFFITHPGLFEKVKSSENEEVKKELSAIMQPITLLYYKERISLVKSVIALVLNAHHEGNLCQMIFLEYFEDIFATKKLEELIWQQYQESCKRELPSQVFAPNERETWLLQLLEEQKILLELLVLCNYNYAHIGPEKYLEYLNLYVRQDFQGSYKSMENDMHLHEYRGAQRKLTQEIGDLCVFHMLSCIRLDVFAEKGSIPEFNKNKNPYNLISSDEYTGKISSFFVTLSEGKDFVTEHIGPVLMSWIALLTWGRGLPLAYTTIQSIDTSEIEYFAPNYDIFTFFQKITKREPFTENSDLACALKYILMSLISRLHTALQVETAKNYSMLVKTTCACLESSGSSDTLRHFWSDDFTNKSGLFLMLDILSKKYPHAAEEFLQLVSVLIGGVSCNYAKEVVEHLDNLQYFSVNVPDDSICEGNQGFSVCKCEMRNNRIVIPAGTVVESFEQSLRGQLLVTWKIRFSLWPVLFDHWENVLESMKQGHQIPENELRNLSQYLEILCKVIILEPALGEQLEVSGLRKPANHALEIAVEVKPREIPNQTISEYLLDTFIEISRIHSPPIRTLSSIISAVKQLYAVESGNAERNPLAAAFKNISFERHGYGGANSPHPLFLSLSKLRIFERSSEDYSITFAMLEFCISIFSDNNCMRIFPMSSTSFLSEALKYCLSEVLPEVLSMSNCYNWRNSQLLLELLKIILEKYYNFIDSSHQSCPFIDLIASQLNKANIAGFIETILQVVAQQSEFNEMSFFNIHWGQTDEAEEQKIIKAMIASGLSALEALLNIVLYVHENGNNNTFIIQAAGDIYRMIYQNSSNDELPIVSSLLTYIPFYLKGAMPEDNDKENMAVLALNNLAKIVLIWEKSNQKATLEYFTTGMFQDIKKDFSHCFEDCFCDKSSALTPELKISVTVAFLEFLIVAVPSQKVFVSGVLMAFDFCNEIKRNFQNLRDLNKENLSVTPLSMMFHVISLYESIVSEAKKYSTLCAKIFQDTVLLNSTVDTVQSLLFMKKDPLGFDLCLFLHSYAAVFRIVTRYLQEKNLQNIAEIVFSIDLLENFLQLSSRVLSSESTLARLQDMDTQLIKIGVASGVSEFLYHQLHSSPAWKLFECNTSQYGHKFKFNSSKLSILLSSLESNSEALQLGIGIFNLTSVEASLLDSQVIGLKSFNTLLSYITSFGYSGKLNSALHSETPTSEIKPLLISSKTNLHENIRETFEILNTIIAITWSGIHNETNLKSPEVISGVNHRFEILMYSFNYIIHIISTKMQQRSDDSEKIKLQFRRLSGKILAELVDFFNNIKHPSHEILSFTLMLLSYFAKANGFESRPEDYIYALVQHLSKFLHVESPNFAMNVACLEYALQLSDKREYVNVFKSLPSNRPMIEKLIDEKCSDLECLSILKYLTSMCKTAAGAKFLISLRLFQHLSACSALQRLKIQNIYEGRQRNPVHILWCWTLLLLSQIAEVMGNDQISLSQMLTFVGEFNWRISRILEFNYVENGKGSGDIVNQKQFSIGYLEELEITLSFMHRLVEGYGLLKKTDKDKVDYWVGLIAAHSMRIFSISTDPGYTFPPVSEHDQRLSMRTLKENLSEKQSVSVKQKRSIFDPVPRSFNESKPKSSTQVSVFSYRVQNLLINALENMLSVFITNYQATRSPLSLDLYSLIGASKYLLSSYTLVSNNTNFYSNLDKISLEEFRDPEITSVTGGISQRFEINFNIFMKTCRRCFEMAGYLIMKFDLNKEDKNIYVKQICTEVISDWIKVTGSEINKSEYQDFYLAHVLDQVST